MEQSETAEKLVKLLKKKNLTVTTAESCTGGMVAAKIMHRQSSVLPVPLPVLKKAILLIPTKPKRSFWESVRIP